MAKTIMEFLHYWYFRYLMITELYMAEKWERHTAHGILLVLFVAFAYLNMKVLVPYTTSLLPGSDVLTAS